MKAQATRNKIMGIYTTDKEQIVFIDTPGFAKPKTALEHFMVESGSYIAPLREVDTCSFMVPADEPRGKGDDMIIELAGRARRLFLWLTRLTRCIWYFQLFTNR